MSMTTAVNAIPGPVAPDYPSPRAATATGPDGHAHDDATRTADNRAGERVGESGGHKDGNAGAGTNTPKDKAGAVVTNPSFKYDSRANRVVMLMHDQATGSIIQQIPSEAALKQYEQAVRRAREDIAYTTPTGSSTGGRTSSIEAASLGLPLPVGGVESGESAATTGGGGQSSTGLRDRPAAQPGTAGSVTAGAGGLGESGARYSITV